MRLAVCQMRSGSDVGANLTEAERLLDEAADAGADLAILPELFPFLGPEARLPEIAEPIPGGPSVEMLGKAAARGQLWIARGERPGAGRGPPLQHRSALRSVGRARRALPEDPSLRRGPRGSAPVPGIHHVQAGTELVTHAIEDLRVGLSICYDLRFPELFRGLMALGAELFVLPAQFQQQTGVAHWEVLLRARAIENQCFVAAAAQWGEFGSPEEPRRSYGHSMVVGPWGDVLGRGTGGGDRCLVRRSRRGRAPPRPSGAPRARASAARLHLLMRRELAGRLRARRRSRAASTSTSCTGTSRRRPTGSPAATARDDRAARAGVDAGDRRLPRRRAGRVRARGVGRLEHGVARRRLRPRGPSRARGLGVELVREAVEYPAHRDLAWFLNTRDAHSLYARFGFEQPERANDGAPPAAADQSSGRSSGRSMSAGAAEGDVDLLDPLGMRGHERASADVAVQVAGLGVDLAGEQRRPGTVGVGDPDDPARASARTRRSARAPRHR